MSRWSRRGASLVAGSVVSATLLLGLGPAVAWAAPQGRIQDVRPGPGTVAFVLSADGLAEGQSIDPDSVRVTIGGVEAQASAAPITESVAAPQRTVMLALDASGSMAQDGKLATAKQAANAYLDALPADVDAGLIAFADEARVVVKPTTDRAEVRRAIDSLKADGSTALNDAVVLAVASLGKQGSRNIVLLSDGEDEGSTTSATQARRDLARSGSVLDAVSLGRGDQQKELAAFAKAGQGTLVTATDAEALTAAFESAARAVQNQLTVRAVVPEGTPGGTTELVATALVGDQRITDSAAVVATAPAPAASASAGYGPIPVTATRSGLLDRPWFLMAVIAAIFVALATIAALAVGALDAKNRKSGRISRRLEEVSAVGPDQPGSPARSAQDTVLGESAAVRRAVSFADRVAESRRSTAIAQRLEEANLALRPGEWVVVHGLIAVLAGLLVTLLTGFSVMATVLAVAAGLILPWLYLGHLAERRRKRFYEALPDAMQMLAGSLSAGYSLPQALDNVAKEAGGPLGQELNRALMESRLGLPIEEALEAAAQRMESRDFHWVVMAIRINRRVGGNLAEVLTNVGKTLRERERLRRQVKALSAEGVLSAWILGLLPFLLIAFMVFIRPEYIRPLLTTPVGWVILGIGTTLYLFGVLWMRKLVRMEVA